MFRIKSFLIPPISINHIVTKKALTKDKSLKIKALN